MLFNSYTFILVFLPITLVIYHLLRRRERVRPAFLWLTIMSFLFYGWWKAEYLLLLIPLVFVDFLIVPHILPRNGAHLPRAKPLLLLGITINLSVLCYFKYANFFVDNLVHALGMHLHLAKIILPIGISFYTFQKLAFLVDAYRGKTDRFNLLNYSLFVSFFPQLIAGPIVHHSEMMPQFRRMGRVPAAWFALGITIFSIGLAKKVLLADTAALYASPQFAAVAQGMQLDFLAAWSAALAYTAQLYFDFSGYSDMAIGAGLMFGIRLPLNFASPYKAHSIIDFWRRWHMTLSRFLRDYLYIQLGGNRKGLPRRYLNLFITMLLGGFWHGAGWTFVIWGGLHGVYLAINNVWRTLRKRIWPAGTRFDPFGRLFAQAVTFIAVVVGWVFFRSENLPSALEMLKAMVGLNGLALPATLTQLGAHLPAAVGPVDSGEALLVAVAFLAIAWFAPNTQQITAYVPPASASETYVGALAPTRLRWRASGRWAFVVGCVFAISLMFLPKISEFIYFQF